MRIITKIRKIISWIPILWRDEHWDGSYMFNILEYKLTRMYKFFTSSKSVTNWDTHKSELKALRICIEILKRKREDFYFETFSYLIDTDMKFIDAGDEFGPNMTMIDPKWEISTNMPLYEKKSKLAEQAEQDRHKLLFKLMEQYAKSWWD